MGLALPAESFLALSFCSIGNITDRTTLHNQEDAKGQRLKQSRPAFAAQEGLVDSAEEGNNAAMRFPSAISAGNAVSAGRRSAAPTREACQLGICQLNFLLEIAPSWTKTVDM